jgi:hypothetical protein
MEIDITKLKYTPDLEISTASKGLPRHKNGEKFLRGPIPEGWLAQASQLPGKTFQVGIAIWLLAGMKNNPTVKLSHKLLRSWGVGRLSCYHALVALEQANLITVKRHRGCNPVVRIIAVCERVGASLSPAI